MAIERQFSRRDILKAGVLLGTAVTLQACGTKTNQETVPTQEQGGQVPTVEQEKTPADEAKARAFDMLLGAMTPESGLKEEKDGLLSHYYKSTSNLNEWSTEIPNVLSGGQSTTVLKGSFIDSRIYGKAFATAEKIAEEVELNNLVVSVKQDQTPTLSAADKANGIEWKGTVGINYIARYRTNFYQIGGSLGKDRAVVEKLATSEETQFPNFSSWIDSSMQLNALLKNGDWVVEYPTIKGNLTSPNMADLFGMITCMGDNPGCVDIKTS